MGRIRTVKPEFHADEELSALPAETHLLAGALLNYADDEGYFNANPGLVKASTHPLRRDKLSTAEQLKQLQAIGYIIIESDEGGKQVGRVRTFETHQKVSHACESKLKTKFEAYGKIREASLKPPENSGNIPEGSGRPPAGLRPELNGIELNGIELNGTGNREAPTAVADGAVGHPFIAFPLTKGKTHIVTEENISVWEEAYPAVDVRQELRKAVVWLDANPHKRSVNISGSKQRIVKWLSRSQNEGGSRGTNHGISETRGDRNVREAIELMDREEAESAGRGSGSPGPVR